MRSTSPMADFIIWIFIRTSVPSLFSLLVWIQPILPPLTLQIAFLVIADESVIALANGCPHLRSLCLYYCQNITDRAMYSLAANSRVKSKHELWDSVQLSSSSNNEKEGLMNLNISQCTALTPNAVQAVCDSFPQLHTCPGRHSLIISGCLNLTSVHCACAVQAHHRAGGLAFSHHAYWVAKWLPVAVLWLQEKGQVTFSLYSCVVMW